MAKPCCLLLVLFSLFITGCVHSVKKKFDREDLKYVNWIKPGNKLKFFSDEQDTTIIQIVGHKDRYSKCSGPMSCDSDEFIRTFRYLQIDSIVSDTLKLAKVTKDHYDTETAVHFGNYWFSINDTMVFQRDFSLNGSNLKDVLKLTKQCTSGRDHDCVHTIWWSLSIGIVQYQTKDGIIWTRY